MLLRYSILSAGLCALINANGQPEKRYEVVYTPTDWKMPKLDWKMEYTVLKPADDAKTTFSFCVRKGGTMLGKTQVEVKEKCSTYTNVMREVAEGGGAMGRCVPFGGMTDGSSRSGYWVSKDINCVLYYDYWCRTEVGGVTQPSVVLQAPGIDDLSHGWWQEAKTLFKYKRNSAGVVSVCLCHCYVFPY